MPPRAADRPPWKWKRVGRVLADDGQSGASSVDVVSVSVSVAAGWSDDCDDAVPDGGTRIALAVRCVAFAAAVPPLRRLKHPSDRYRRHLLGLTPMAGTEPAP